MKTIALVTLVAALLSLSTLWAQNTHNDQKTVKRLEARLQALEARIAALEKRTEIKYITVPSVPSTLVPPSVSKPDSRWKPFEFNGQTYYAVPLGQAQGEKK